MRTCDTQRQRRQVRLQCLNSKFSPNIGGALSIGRLTPLLFHFSIRDDSIVVCAAISDYTCFCFSCRLLLCSVLPVPLINKLFT